MKDWKKSLLAWRPARQLFVLLTLACALFVTACAADDTDGTSSDTHDEVAADGPASGTASSADEPAFDATQAFDKGACNPEVRWCRNPRADPSPGCQGFPLCIQGGCRWEDCRRQVQRYCGFTVEWCTK